MNQLSTLIFSRNRAAQLNLLLDSIEDNFKDITSATILYKATSDEFKKGYDIVKSYHSQIKFRFIEERDFVSDVKQIVNIFNTPYTLINVDDEIYINKIDINNYLKYLEEPTNHTISLRLSPKVNHTYTTNTPYNISMQKYNTSDLFYWRWQNFNLLMEVGYPSCLNSHIYPTNFFKQIINNLPFRSVNNLEEVIHTQRNYFKPFMLCFDKAITVSVANNKVQTEIPTNKCSDKIYNTSESINSKFLDGYKISTENFYGMESNQATIEKDFIWIK